MVEILGIPPLIFFLVFFCFTCFELAGRNMLRISLAAALVGVGVSVVASDVLTCDDVGALETCSSGSGSCRTVSLCPKFLLVCLAPFYRPFYPEY